MKSGPLISVKDLSKIYSSGEIKFHALKKINLEINEGEFVAIMGASGSGKSTFMNILGCLDNATEGDYFLEGKNVRLYKKDELAFLRNQKLGFIFQSFNILARTSAIENVELPLMYNRNVSTKERRAKALEALKLVGLGDRIDAYPNQLSGGQQQRVAIARALINEPVVILADEPTGNLDSRTSYEIMDIFQKLNDKGRTIVMITHEPDIAQFALSNIVFKDGQIVSNKKVTDRKFAEKELLQFAKPESISE